MRETPKRSARSRSVSCRAYQAHARHDQKCDYRKQQRASPMPRDSPQSQGPGPPLKPRLEICTERLDPSPSRLRLDVVYAEQPPAASSINAADACSAGPSGVGLGRRAGTVASARTELGRPEERHAERACAADASTLPPSSRGKVKLYTGTLNAFLYPRRAPLFQEAIVILPNLGSW